MNNSKINKIGTGNWWLWIGGILFIMLAGCNLFNKNNSKGKEVFAQLYQPEKKVLNDILDNMATTGFAKKENPRTDSLETALNFYKIAEFEEALNYLNDLVQRYPNDHTARLYLALSLLQKAKYAKAAEHFLIINEVKNFKHKDITDWYLALSYLGFNSEEGWKKAKEQLKIIANNSESSYQIDAKDALSML